jgi:hypothetical protein
MVRTRCGGELAASLPVWDAVDASATSVVTVDPGAQLESAKLFTEMRAQVAAQRCP